MEIRSFDMFDDRCAWQFSVYFQPLQQIGIDGISARR